MAITSTKSNKVYYDKKEENISSSITTIKPSLRTAQEILDDKTKSIGYLYDGVNVVSTEISNKNCLAKHVQVIDKEQTKIKYFLLTSIHGELYNPWGLYVKKNISDYASQGGKSHWNFKEVNEETFNRYLNFLKTRNEAHLSIAERNVKDA